MPVGVATEAEIGQVNGLRLGSKMTTVHFAQEIADMRLKRGFTLIELLVVIAIIGVLFALILAAVQSARRASLQAQCLDHLRQIGLGFQQHHDSFGLFPSNGGWDGAQTISTTDGKPFTPSTTHFEDGLITHWGVGDPTLAPAEQTGPWSFTILPFIEQRATFDKRDWTKAVAIYACPARRPAALQVAANDDVGVFDGGGYAWGKIDYAANAFLIKNRPVCARIADIRDGTSNMILAGEKVINPRNYTSGTWSWDEPFFLGGSHGTKRGNPDYVSQGSKVLRDSFEIFGNDNFAWGSAHPGGANILFGDGSARILRFSTPSSIVAALESPSGGEVVNPD